jgi:hypothetical protein
LVGVWKLVCGVGQLGCGIDGVGRERGADEVCCGDHGTDAR